MNDPLRTCGLGLWDRHGYILDYKYYRNELKNFQGRLIPALVGRLKQQVQLSDVLLLQLFEYWLLLVESEYMRSIHLLVVMCKPDACSNPIKPSMSHERLSLALLH